MDALRRCPELPIDIDEFSVIVAEHGPLWRYREKKACGTGERLHVARKAIVPELL
jgi:hypothetical protein